MADAQFAIDIAAEMDGGAETTAQLDALSATLIGGGKNAAYFQDAIAKVSNELTGASAASKASAAALAEGNAEYARLERAAVQSAKALERAGQKASGAVPADLAIKAREAAAAVDAHAEKLRGLEGAAKGAAAREADLARTLKNLNVLHGHVNKTLAQNSEKLEKLRGGLGALGGSLGATAGGLLAPLSGFAKLSESVGGATAVTLAAAVGLAAVTAALVVGGAAALTWGVRLASSAREAGLLRDASEALHPELAALRGTIDAIEGETGQSAAGLRKLAGTLREAQVSAEDMPAALRAAALAETALGQGGSAEFVASLRAGKGAARDLAAATSAALGGVVAKQMQGLGAQSDRLGKNLAATFGGLNIDPVLEGMRILGGLFDANTAAGAALKFAFEAVFQPVIDKIPAIATGLEALALQALILGLKVYIGIKPWIPLLEDVGLVVLAAGAAFALTFAPAVWAGVVALGALVASAALAAAPFLAVGAAIVGVYEAFQHWTEIKAAVAGVLGDVATVGTDIVAGIARGIVDGAGALISAIGGAVTGAIDHAKKLLGIASPSKVFAMIGGQTAEGFAGGVDSGAPEAQASMAALVSPADAVKQAQLSGDVGGSAAAAPSGGGANLAGATFNFYGVEGAEDAVRRFGEVVTRILEGDAASLGAA